MVINSLSQELFLDNMLERFLVNKEARYKTPAEPGMYNVVEEFILNKRTPIK